MFSLNVSGFLKLKLDSRLLSNSRMAKSMVSKWEGPWSVKLTN